MPVDNSWESHLDVSQYLDLWMCTIMDKLGLKLCTANINFARTLQFMIIFIVGFYLLLEIKS
jgi:hypothetical protein